MSESNVRGGRVSGRLRDRVTPEPPKRAEVARHEFPGGALAVVYHAPPGTPLEE